MASRRSHRVALATLCCAVAVLGPAAPAFAAAPTAAVPCAASPETATLAAGASRTGAIDLHLFGALGAPVDFF